MGAEQFNAVELLLLEIKTTGHRQQIAHDTFGAPVSEGGVGQELTAKVGQQIVRQIRELNQGSLRLKFLFAARSQVETVLVFPKLLDLTVSAPPLAS